jgi:hypothetical protein
MEEFRLSNGKRSRNTVLNGKGQVDDGEGLFDGWRMKSLWMVDGWRMSVLWTEDVSLMDGRRQFDEWRTSV